LKAVQRVLAVAVAAAFSKELSGATSRHATQRYSILLQMTSNRENVKARKRAPT